MRAELPDEYPRQPVAIEDVLLRFETADEASRFIAWWRGEGEMWFQNRRAIRRALRDAGREIARQP